MGSILRLTWRRLRRSPGYVLAFVLTLGLGIGINTAIFSVVNGVLLAPLPYADADRLVYLRHPATSRGLDNIGFSFVEIADLKEGVRSLDAFVEYGDLTFNVVGEGEPHRAVGGIVSSNYFDVLGLRPVLGRTLQAQDDGQGAEPAMVLTHGYWQRVFGGDPEILGRVLKLYVFSEPKTVRVVGVMAPGALYTGIRQQDFFVNYAASAHYGGASMLDERTHRMTDLFARLSPGQSVDAARRELALVHGRLAQSNPGAYPSALGLEVQADPWRDALTAEARPMLLILAGTVALVLLLACANVANLTLTRLVRRERELAVQAALGGSERRIRAELLAENLVLALAGAGLGLLLALVCRGVLVQYASRYTVRTGEIAMDWRVLGLTGLIAVAAAVLLAWAPRLPGLETSGVAGRGGVGVARKRLQGALVAGQLALCFALLIGAALMVRTLVNLSRVDSGISYENVIALDVPNFTGMPSETNLTLMQQLQERAASASGVRAAAYASHVPFADATPVRLTVQVEGRNDEEIASPPIVQNFVSPEYFEVVGVPILEGRAFTRADDATGEGVVVLSAALAKQLFADADPLGRRVRQQQFNGQWGEWVRVVGVAADTREDGFVGEPTHTVYRPGAQTFPGQSLVLRLAGPIPPVLEQVQRAVRELDPERPMDNVVTLDALRYEDLAPPRLNATLFSAFALLALIIAAVGVLGVLAFNVSQRTQEFGVRMALGARREQVLAMVLGEGGVLLAIALGAGVLGSLALARFLRGIVFEVGTADPLTYGAVALLLSAVALVAAWLPARRATRVDPVEALRSE